MAKSKRKKIFIVMPAYNVEKLVEGVFKRIPKIIFRKVRKLIIVNDNSIDNTLKVLRKIAKIYPRVEIMNKKQNEGYARAQKTGFAKALDEGADIIVLLHSDGQYAPEELLRLLEPLEKGHAHLVQGSRMLGGGALKGGMPIYKYIANKSLSYLENMAFGMNIAEYHSGYMLYSRKTLEKVPFMKLSDTFHFDGEMMFMAHKKKLKIKEIAIPTRYAGETSNLKPIQYGIDVLKIIIKYKLGKYNF